MATRMQMAREFRFRRALRIRDEIAHIFVDADHWNRSVRRSGEDPIDPDPDGALMRYLSGLSHMLEIASAQSADRKS